MSLFHSSERCIESCLHTCMGALLELELIVNLETLQIFTHINTSKETLLRSLCDAAFTCLRICRTKCCSDRVPSVSKPPSKTTTFVSYFRFGNVASISLDEAVHTAGVSLSSLETSSPGTLFIRSLVEFLAFLKCFRSSFVLGRSSAGIQ